MTSYSFDKKTVLDGKNTIESITNDFLRLIDTQEDLHAFLTVNSTAKELAQHSDTLFASGNNRSLEGMSIAIKDNISTKGIQTTCASKMLDGFIPVYDATVVERIVEAGGIILGKTNMDEFAMGSSGETSYYGVTKHPHDNNYVPGGSSSGSAVAVAAGFCHASLGSDTGGSVRQPAAFCGVYGFKPSYGRISRYGLIAFASSLDQIGIFSRDIDTMSLVFDAISGKDQLDSTSSSLPPTQSYVAVNKSLTLSDYTIAVLPEEELSGISDDVRKVYDNTVSTLQSLGVKIITKNIPASSAWIPTYYILATAEASSNLARFDGVRFGHKSALSTDSTTANRSEGFGKEVKRRIMLGTYVLSSGYYDAYYIKAQKARRLISNGYDSIFAEAQALLLPTTPGTPFTMGEKNDPLEMYLSDYFTVSANISGVPAISFPAGTNDKGFSVGMQLQAAFNNDELLLALTKAISAHMS